MRLKWIDTARFFCIFAVFIGHYFDKSYLGIFVWKWHILALFFLAGCSAYCSDKVRNNTFFKDVNSAIRGLLIPYIFFGLLALLFSCFYDNRGIDLFFLSFKSFVRGTIRNTFFTTQIWFLTCLLVIKLIFSLNKKISGRKYIQFFVGLSLWELAEFFNIYNGEPRMLYNVDSALHYYIYYLLGYHMLPFIDKSINLTKNKWIFHLFGMAGTVYTAGVYWMINGLYSFSVKNYFIEYHLQVLQVLPVILTVVYYSSLINCKAIIEIGQKTLYLCGNEGLVNFLWAVVFEMFGIQIAYKSPIAVMMMALVRILFIIYFIYPWQKVIIEKMQENYLIEVQKLKSIIGKPKSGKKSC